MNEHNVLITGVSSGIGRATALDLDRRGFRVIGSVRKEADAQGLAGACSDRFSSVLMDLADHDSIRRAAETVAERVGGRGLHGLVNNAGMIMSAPLEHLDLDEFERLLAVNVTGQIAVTQAFLPMVRAAPGRIVMVGSVSGLSALPMIGPYCASKFALEAVTDSLRMELTPWRIPVSIIEPGSATTAIMSHASESVEHSGFQAEYTGMVRGMQVGFRRSERGGIPPAVVADRIHHALTARRPRTRYLVGRVAYVRSFSRLLPDRLGDWLKLRALQKQATMHDAG